VIQLAKGFLRAVAGYVSLIEIGNNINLWLLFAQLLIVQQSVIDLDLKHVWFS
jgi:hypothetical protein